MSALSSESIPPPDAPAEPPPAPPASVHTQNPTPGTQYPLAEARAAHAELTRAAQFLRRALLARLEKCLTDDPAALGTEQIANGVKILEDLVSIEKTLLANQLLVDHLESRHAAAASAPSPAPPTSPAPSTAITPINHPTPSAPNAVAATPSAPQAASSRTATPSAPAPLRWLPPISSFAIRYSSFNSAPISSFAIRYSSLTVAPASVRPVRPCPYFTPHQLQTVLGTLDARIQSFPPRTLSPNWQTITTPDYTTPAPGYKPPIDNRFPIGKPHPTLRPDPQNPGRYHWVHPKKSRPNTS